MTYDEWLPTIPDLFKRDPLWRRTDYRLATFAADCCWPHVRRLASAWGTRRLSDQLFRAVCAIGADIAEGYSRSGRADRIRFYEYALGSSRESLSWYWRARHVIGESDALAQLDVIDQIVRLQLTTIKAERERLDIDRRWKREDR